MSDRLLVTPEHLRLEEAYARWVDYGEARLSPRNLYCALMLLFRLSLDELKSAEADRIVAERFIEDALGILAGEGIDGLESVSEGIAKLIDQRDAAINQRNTALGALEGVLEVDGDEEDHDV